MRYVIEAHSGFGDQLHQRAPLRKMLARGDEVWMTATAPCLFHDLVATGKLHLMDAKTKLRTQIKNVQREAQRFSAVRPVFGPRTKQMRVYYNGAAVKKHGSVVNALCWSFGVDAKGADFRLPVPAAWLDKTPLPQRPFILYRPPVARTEWGGAAARNPDPVAFAAIFDAIRAGFQVVSVADLEAGAEWMIGQPVADAVEYHRGEMDIEQLAALASRAAFVYTTPGFLTVLAQAVQAPCVTVFGGYERAASYSSGATYAPWLPVEPITPCDCWAHAHACVKQIDVEASICLAQKFVAELRDGSRQAA